MSRTEPLSAVLIEHNREKLLNAVVYFLGNTRYCGTVKLCKLLYFLDFMHFRETGKSVTGLKYHAWEYGPVPPVFWRELKSPKKDLSSAVLIPGKERTEDFTEMKPVKKFDRQWFSKRESRILDYLSRTFRDSLADQMVKVAHMKNAPWDITVRTKGMDAEIDYMLALDSGAGSISREEALERSADRDAIKKAWDFRRHSPFLGSFGE